MTTDKEDYEFGEEPLKKVDIVKIEEAIANSISEIADEEYIVSITNIDFEPRRSPGTIELNLRLTKPNIFLQSLSEE